MIHKLHSFIQSFLLYNVYNWNWLHLMGKYTVRPAILRYCGAKIGEGVYLSRAVYFDNNLEYLVIEDNAGISPKAILLFHRRNLTDFKQGDRHLKQPFIKKEIRICRNATVGVGAIVLPGVTIGEGSCVGSGAVVTKDVPAWSVVAGNPAKVIRTFLPREQHEL